LNLEQAASHAHGSGPAEYFDPADALAELTPADVLRELYAKPDGFQFLRGVVDDLLLGDAIGDKRDELIKLLGIGDE
jgi:hypothetical protein